MSSSPESPTQAFNSEEMRANQARVEGINSTFQPPERCLEYGLETTSGYDVATLTEAFNNATLASPPNTRLVLSFPRLANSLSHPAIVHLPHTIGGWGLVGVVQRTSDVRWSVTLPVSSPAGTAINMRLSVYYDPGRDSCVLVNGSEVDIWLSSLGFEAGRVCVGPKQLAAIIPGLWRLSFVEIGAVVESYVLDMLIRRRQFVVNIREGRASSPPSSKRRAGEDLSLTASKRLRQDGDETECLLVPTTNLPPAQLSRPTAITAVTPLVTTASRVVSSATAGSPLLLLKNGDTAAVRAIAQQPSGNQLGGHSRRARKSFPESSVETANSPSYELRRLENVAITPLSRVFTAQHSALLGDIVAKVIRYEGVTPVDLISCARNWIRETRFIQALDHRNIISLKSSDSRLFSLYLERLPSSLSRGSSSPFDPSDAYNILQGTSSALAYLKLQRVVHNDVKPANITYSPQRGAVLIDFGLATVDTDPVSNGGTPWYVPPEFANERGESRNTCGDIWALGVTMLYVLGRIPLPERSSAGGWLIQEVARGRQGEARQKMDTWVAAVQDARMYLDRTDLIEELVYRMVDKSARNRVQAADIVAAFE